MLVTQKIKRWQQKYQHLSVRVEQEQKNILDTQILKKQKIINDLEVIWEKKKLKDMEIDRTNLVPFFVLNPQINKFPIDCKNEKTNLISSLNMNILNVYFKNLDSYHTKIHKTLENYMENKGLTYILNNHLDCHSYLLKPLLPKTLFKYYLSCLEELNLTIFTSPNLNILASFFNSPKLDKCILGINNFLLPYLNNKKYNKVRFLKIELIDKSRKMNKLKQDKILDKFQKYIHKYLELWQGECKNHPDLIDNYVAEPNNIGYLRKLINCIKNWETKLIEWKTQMKEIDTHKFRYLKILEELICLESQNLIYEEEIKIRGDKFRNNLLRISKLEEFLQKNHNPVSKLLRRNTRIEKIEAYFSPSNEKENINIINTSLTKKIKNQEHIILQYQMFLAQLQNTNDLSNNEIQTLELEFNIMNNIYHHKIQSKITKLRDILDSNLQKIENVNLKIDEANEFLKKLQEYRDNLQLQQQTILETKENIDLNDTHIIRPSDTKSRSQQYKIKVRRHFLKLYQDENHKLKNQNQKYQIKIKNNKHKIKNLTHKIDKILLEGLEQVDMNLARLKLQAYFEWRSIESSGDILEYLDSESHIPIKIEYPRDISKKYQTNISIWLDELQIDSIPIGQDNETHTLPDLNIKNMLVKLINFIEIYEEYDFQKCQLFEFINNPTNFSILNTEIWDLSLKNQFDDFLEKEKALQNVDSEIHSFFSKNKEVIQDIKNNMSKLKNLEKLRKNIKEQEYKLNKLSKIILNT